MEIPLELCLSSNVATTQCGTPALLKHLHEFQRLGHNMVVCCDDTSKLAMGNRLVLFGTNIANEMFEYAKAVSVSATHLKALLLKNVAAIFADDEVKAWVRA